MKGKKLYVLIGLAVVAIATLVYFSSTIKAELYTSKMKDFELSKGQLCQSVSNAGIEGFVKMGSSALPFLIKNLASDNQGVITGSII